MKKWISILFLVSLFLGLALPAFSQDGGPPPDRELNDSQEPGSVLVFPKFIRGRVTTPEQGVLPVTEIEIGAVCPPGEMCPQHQPVHVLAHWVCPGPPDGGICQETDFKFDFTVTGKRFFNPDGFVPYPRPRGFINVPQAPCREGFLIVWVVDDFNRPIKFDGLIGDAVIRDSGVAAEAYTATPIQANPALATGALTSADGNLNFDGVDGYKAVTGTIIGDVRYSHVDERFPIRTFLTVLTLDIWSNTLNNPINLMLNFFDSDENLLSTAFPFTCWREIELTRINANLNDVFMGRKGVFFSTRAMFKPIFPFRQSGPATLLGLVETLEFTSPTLVQREFATSVLNDSVPVPTVFRP